jgi:hypothetical protein
LRLPAKVVLRGDLLEREELDRRRAELRAKQRVLREAQSKPLPVGEPEKPTGDLVMHGSVETTGAGIKLSAERYVVVRRYDGSLVYSGRVLSPGQAALPASELFVQQTIRGGELVAYEARIEVQGRVLTYKGELAGGKMSVERRIDGKFFDNNTVSEKILCVDFGSVTTELVLGYHGRPGEFNALYLEGYEPAHGRYELRVAPDGSTHHVRTASGEMKATFDAIGAPKEVWRQRGTIAARTRSLEAVADDGKGLPTPLDKQTTEAGSPR